MVTLIDANLLSASRIMEAGKRLGIEIRTADSEDAPGDSFYIIDCNQPSGLEAAKKVKNANPEARIVCFYPHVRKDIKAGIESLGCRAYTNAEFFAKLHEILKSSGNN